MSGNVAVLWHLHQPDYRHPRTGVPVMPWARLHGLRGYYDLFREAVDREPPVTLNLVPVLLEQLDHYAAGGADEHLDLTQRPADSLDAAAVERVRATFRGGHPAMIQAHPRWANLSAALADGRRLSVAELRDVQVWSTLAWFGGAALVEHPVLAALREQGAAFTEADKASMLEAQAAILAEIPRLLVRVAASRTAISVSPWAHPILPLLVDVYHAGRCQPSPPADLRFAWPEDATTQLRRAREDFARRFGRPVAGLWPSEGAVSPEVVERVAEAGFSWLATDEGVLARSEVEGGVCDGGWDLGHGVVGFFRDHDLSDRVGFQYRDRRAVDAVTELIRLATRRARGGVRLIALDGENPWESWPDAGVEFRARLDLALDRVGVTLDDAARDRTVGRVRRLHTGSWIGADLRIWAGDAADHAAWRLLAEARAAVQACPDPVRRAAAMEPMLRAEGSDWFWWLGPEFDTPFAATFDGLLRAHLAAVWEALDLPAPASLDVPLSGAGVGAVEAPVGLIDPSAGDWEGWRGAGRIRWPRGGSMAGAEALADAAFGWDEEGRWWLRQPLPAARPGEVWVVRVGDAEVAAGRGAAPVTTGSLRLSFTPEALVVSCPAAGGVRLIRREGDDTTTWPSDGVVFIEAPPNPPARTWWSV